MHGCVVKLFSAAMKHESLVIATLLVIFSVCFWQIVYCCFLVFRCPSRLHESDTDADDESCINKLVVIKKMRIAQQIPVAPSLHTDAVSAPSESVTTEITNYQSAELQPVLQPSVSHPNVDETSNMSNNFSQSMQTPPSLNRTRLPSRPAPAPVARTSIAQASTSLSLVTTGGPSIRSNGKAVQHALV